MSSQNTHNFKVNSQKGSATATENKRLLSENLAGKKILLVLKHWKAVRKQIVEEYAIRLYKAQVKFRRYSDIATREAACQLGKGRVITSFI